MKLKSLIISLIGFHFLAVSSSAFGATETAQSLTFNDYLKLVETQSPDLIVEKSIKDEAQAKSSGIRLNPPMIGFMTMKEAGSTARGLEISQEIPFPTKIFKEKETRNLEVQMQNSYFSYRRQEILLQARLTYFEFWKAFEKLKIIKEKRDWLKTHTRITRSATRSDSESQIHLLDIESELDMLENEVLEAESNLIEKRQTLKTMAPELKDLNFNAVTPEPATLEINSRKKSALIESKEKIVQKAEADLNLKKQSYLPDFFIRYRKFNESEMLPKNEEIMIGVSLPFLFFWQSKSESAEASAKLTRAQAELQKIKIQTETSLTGLLQKQDSLKKQLDTLNEKLIPRAHRRMKLVGNLSTRTMDGLEAHRSVMLDYLELRTKAIDARFEFENTLAEILKLSKEAQ